MAQNVTVAGASYSDVPSLILPKTGGGTSSFFDVSDTTAAAADVASGKYFYTSAGVRTAGTASGGGGDRLVLIQTTALGSLSTSSSTATDTGKTISLASTTGWQGYDLLIVVISTDSQVNGRHTSDVSSVFITGQSDIDTKNSYSVAGNVWVTKRSSGGVTSSRYLTSKYGVYINAVSASNNTLTMTVYYRYSSNNTGTLNGTYTARVYGIKLIDLIGG